jgi:hypothetical protein
LTAELGDLLDGATEAGTRTQIKTSDRCAGFRQANGDPLTNAAAGAGNKRNLSFKAE